MSGQECLRLQYGKKYKRVSTNTYNGHEISPHLGSRNKSAMDDDFFGSGGDKKKMYC